MQNLIKIALIQMKVGPDTSENIKKAVNSLEHTAKNSVDCAVLPEMFSCPYSAENFPSYAEPAGGPVWQVLSKTARRLGITIVGGSFPEKEDSGKIFNTSFVFDPSGKEIARHRKIHLFDINIAGGQHFRESDTLSPGNSPTLFRIKERTFGLAICYDIRFPELFRLMTDRGALGIIIPGAFNMTTGPPHWELLFRCRALDNQVFTLGAAPARNSESSYTSYGNSIIASPWGEVLGRLDGDEGILIREIDLSKAEALRQELPLLRNRRKDIYSVVFTEKGEQTC